MVTTRSILIACLAIAPGALIAVHAHPAAAQDDPPPMEVTTDTREYCFYLVGRVHTLEQASPVPAPQEVPVLAADGQRMCEHGQTRGGIMRLRRAMMLLMHDDEPAGR
jgi:hypothetical protein